MIKPFKVLATGSLVLMLAACNANDHNNAAFDAQRGLNGNNNNVSKVSYHRGDNVGDAFRMRNGNDVAEGLRTSNNGFTGTRDFAYNTRNNPRHNSSNELAGSMDNSISADFTNISSGNYPHTRAIQVQDAKFGYVVVGPQGANGQGMNMADLRSMTEQYARQFQSQAAPRGQWAQWGLGGQNAQQFAQAGQTQQRPQMQQPTQQRPIQQAPTTQRPTVQRPTQQAPTTQQPTVQKPTQQAPTTQQQKPATQPTQQAKTTTTAGISATEQRVIDLTNAERQKAGIKPLVADAKLSSVARKKSEDMQAKGYFSHTSPTYGSPFDMMRDFGITYSTAGENIAQGQRTPEEVVNAWMNSEGHRRNILNPAFTNIGVGYESTGNHWTQQFIGK